MNVSSLIRNALSAFSAQAVSMLASILTTLLVPKVLGVEGFGYWQLFIMYCMYSQFFMLGQFDGIYLKEGGKLREELNKREVNTQYAVCVVSQSIIGILIAFFSFSAVPDGARSFVFCSFGVYVALSNMTLALGYVFQAINETRTFSRSVMIDRGLFMVVLVVLLVLGIDDFRPYVLFYLCAKACSLFYCWWSAQDILYAGYCDAREAIVLCVDNIRIGIHIAVATIADTLILGTARMVIDVTWGIEVFGSVSFALSMINFFIAFVGQVCIVFFPALRRSSADELKKIYILLRDGLEAFFPLVYLLYYPAVFLLLAWLPQYEGSVRYLAMLLPVCVFDSKMNICSATYMKVLRKERAILVANCLTVVASIAISVVGAKVFGNVDCIVLGVSFCIMARSTLSELWLDRLIGVKTSRLMPGEIVLTALFVVSSLSVGGFIGLVVYLVAVSVFLTAHRSTFGLLVSGVRRIATGKNPD